MRKKTSTDYSIKHIKKEDLCLPPLQGLLESTLKAGNLFQVDGTNVVRVPFGVRQSRKQKPEKISRMALVLPINPLDSPNPPPQAA